MLVRSSPPTLGGKCTPVSETPYFEVQRSPQSSRPSTSDRYVKSPLETLVPVANPVHRRYPAVSKLGYSRAFATYCCRPLAYCYSPAVLRSTSTTIVALVYHKTTGVCEHIPLRFPLVRHPTQPRPTLTPPLIHTVLRSHGQKYEHGNAPTRVMSHVVNPQYLSSTHMPTLGAPGGATRGYVNRSADRAERERDGGEGGKDNHRKEPNRCWCLAAVLGGGTSHKLASLGRAINTREIKSHKTWKRLEQVKALAISRRAPDVRRQKQRQEAPTEINLANSS